MKHQLKRLGDQLEGLKPTSYSLIIPIEDRRAEAKLQNVLGNSGSRYLFGIFDGHAGHGCAQSVSERIFDYVSVGLSTPDILHRIKDG